MISNYDYDYENNPPQETRRREEREEKNRFSITKLIDFSLLFCWYIYLDIDY